MLRIKIIKINLISLLAPKINMQNNHKKQPLVTIITVVFNAENFIEETILNVISQNYLNIEYIIVDGGSTDNTLEIIEKYKNKISYNVSAPDLGIYDAMNKGVKISSGEWIIFMNSGDVFANSKVISNFFSNKINPSVKLIYGNTIVKDRDKKIIPPAIINRNFFFFETICHQSIFINKNVFQEIGFHNLNFRIISDREFLLRASSKNLKFTYFDIDVCIWDSYGFSLQNIHLIENEVQQMRKIHFKTFDIFVIQLRNWMLSFKNKIVRLLHQLS